MQEAFHKLFKLIDYKKQYQQKSIGLNYLQQHIIEKIFQEKTMKTLEISKAMDISPSTLIGVLDELERQDLVKRERQNDDKRVVVVSTTEQGAKVVKKHFKEDELFLYNLLKNLNADEQKQLIELLDKMTDSIVDPEALFE